MDDQSIVGREDIAVIHRHRYLRGSLVWVSNPSYQRLVTRRTHTHSLQRIRTKSKAEAAAIPNEVIVF